MKSKLTLLALTMLALLMALPTTASASWFHRHHNRCCACQSSCDTCGSGKCGSYHAEAKCGVGTRSMAYSGDSNDNYAVAGYNDTMRGDNYNGMDDYNNGNGYSRSMADVDAARIAEYHNIYGDGNNYAVAGYTRNWRPWMNGGTYVTVNGQRMWATPNDFTWSNNRWTWNDDPSTTVMFEDPRFNVNSRDWSMSWSPWSNGGTYVNVNGQRVWATPNDFTWDNNRWTWNDDPTATVSFDDDRFDVNAQDWGVGNISHDKFDLPVDRNKLDLDTDKLKTPDKLEIK